MPDILLRGGRVLDSAREFDAQADALELAAREVGNPGVDALL